MTTQNINEQKEYHLIQPYDGSYEPNHYNDEHEATIIEDEDEEVYEEIIEEEEYL